MMRPSRKRQSGVALLTAVMVVAFASTVAAGMMVRQNLIVHRSGNMLQHDLAWWYLIGLEEWAATLLDRDAQDNQFDHFGELWAQPIDFLPVDEGALAGRLIDLQGRFNLLSLIDGAGQADPAAIDALTRLLNQLDAARALSAQEVAVAIADWMDQDSNPGFPGGAEDGVYLSRERPFRAPNQAMESLTELRLVEGVTPKLYAELSQHVALYPGDAKINVNTASLPVLLSLSSKLTPAQAEGIIQKREQTPYEKTADFVGDTLVAGTGITADQVTVQTEFFHALGSAQIGRVRLQFVSLLMRTNGQPTRVLAHSRNTL